MMTLTTQEKPLLDCPEDLARMGDAVLDSLARDFCTLAQKQLEAKPDSTQVNFWLPLRLHKSTMIYMTDPDDFQKLTPGKPEPLGDFPGFANLRGLDRFQKVARGLGYSTQLWAQNNGDDTFSFCFTVWTRSAEVTFLSRLTSVEDLGPKFN